MEGNSLFSEKPTIYEGSAQYVNADLSYAIPATDVSMDKVSARVPYFPITSLKEPYAPIEFLITPDSYGYIGLKNTQLSVLARVVRQDGTFCDATDVVAPCNLTFQHLFRHVEVYLNGTPVMDCPFYPTMAHITRLLSCNPLEKQHDLKSEYWYPDETPEDFTVPAVGKPPNGFQRRLQYTNSSWQFALLGKLVGNVFTQGRLFPPSTEIRIILRRNLPELSLDCAVETKAPYVGCPYRINLDEAILYVSKKPVTTAVVKMHEELLNKGETLKFPMVEREIKTFSMPQGVTSFTADSLVLGRIPKIMVIRFVSQKGWLGSLKKSPVNYQSKNISEMMLTWSGDSLESRTINYSFASTVGNTKDSFLVALDMLRQTAANPELGNALDRDNYKKGKETCNCIKIYSKF